MRESSNNIIVTLILKLTLLQIFQEIINFLTEIKPTRDRVRE